ncbi:MAG: 16S rRNA (guanine(966)-N(2))-methyltransferase RsmD [Microthrixaceae bacterium]
MRVVAGTARGRRLVTPAGVEVRPTSDRVREAVFNSLGSLDVLHDAAVLDLFAGSGALGVEALSRGADHVEFVDSSAASLRAVRTNLATCGLLDSATVVRADALVHLRRLVAHGRSFDVALLDPPYVFDDWGELLATVPAEVLVVESDRAVDVEPHATVLRERRYGGTVVTIARRVASGRRDRAVPLDPDPPAPDPSEAPS